MSLSFITDNPDRESTLRAVVDREPDRLKYRRLAAWFDYLEKRAQLGMPSQDQVERLAEIKASRYTAVNNIVVTDVTYVSKSGHRARYADGNRLEITDPYLRDSWLLINEVVRETSARAVAKLEKSAGPGAGAAGS